MNETTRALVRAEITRKRNFIGTADRLAAAGHPEAACHRHTVQRMKTDIVELESALAISTAEPQIAHGEVDLTHGMILHIHNA